LAPDAALGALDRLLTTSGVSQAVVAQIDWNRAAGAAPLLEAFRRPERQQASSDVMLRIREAPASRRIGGLTNYVAAQLAKAIGLGSAETIELDRGLVDLGIDSLIAIELRNHLQSDLGVPLEQTVIFDYPTLRALSGHLAAHLFPADAAEEVSPAP